MNRFIRELRRREVFRAAGLYVGICWILIEGASVVLPAFDAPEWAMKAMIIAAVVGFPIMLVLAWVYDITDHGIVVQEEATDTVVVPFGGRRTDFVVIGVLSVALIFSVYLNVTTDPVAMEQPDPVSVLIADFKNATGDPVFDGTLEQTLSIGIEGASFVTAFNRLAAKKQIEKLQPNGTLDEEGARLIAVREGIKLVLSGEIREDDGRYLFSVRGVEPEMGEVLVEVEEKAKDRNGVLIAVAEATDEIREQLGDTSIEKDSLRSIETFTASSIDAAHDYTRAQNAAFLGDYDSAVELYKSAIDRDPDFGRAFSGWAVAAHHLGRAEEAEEKWKKALSLMETMTPRERYRTLGTYYMVVSGNYQKAIENFETLVEEYPADGAGHNNLAVSYFSTLDFERAMEEGARVLEIYPNSIFYKLNAALYSMYAGDFEASEAQGREVIAADESRYYARIPVAIAALSRGDLDGAKAAYRDMAATGKLGASHANLGLADVAIYEGLYPEAIALLNDGIAADSASGNQRAASTKYIALAEARQANGDGAESVADALNKAFEIHRGTSQMVAAARLYLELGQNYLGPGLAIAAELAAGLQPQQRAYAQLLRGIVDSKGDRHADAIDKFVAATKLSDSWLLRFELGKAYLRAGSYAEALDEFNSCEQRKGEASAVFLDDLPTWRYIAELPYWRARAQQEIGMSDAAKQSYAEFLAIRNEGRLAEDARERQASL
jgi:tetratricopeptide (TPR) repeat protein